MGIGSAGLGFLAGILSVLSPCVLPLLPLVFGAAITGHRLGVPALALGLAVSFVTIGLFIATIGFAIGFDGDALRTVSAVLLLIFGMVLLSETLQTHVAVAASPFGNHVGTWSPGGVFGQFAVGVMLGAIWSPCVGPTLGAAALLAAQSSEMPGVAAAMVAFGFGAALPLVLIGALSRQTLLRWRTRLLRTGKIGKRLLGVALFATGALVLSDADHTVETALVTLSPDWLTNLTTRF
jgi:cytochrome c-type biogenesis protein